MKREEEIEYLESKIIQYNEQYRKGHSEITDKEYDDLLLNLYKLDPENPLLKKGIIETVEGTPRKQKLPHPMYSLNKVKSVQEVMEWIYDKEIKDLFVIMPKYNGISLLVDKDTYPRRQDTWTRGDGEHGQLSTDHFNELNSFGFNRIGMYGGEAIISHENWNKYFKDKISPSGNKYKLNNATVAGLFNNNSPTPELKHVDFIPYYVFDKEGSDKVDQLEFIKGQGFPVESLLVNVKSINDELLDLLFNEWKTIYPIDGLVIECNSADIRKQLGRESNNNPTYSRAIKLDHWTEEADTVIEGYNFTISKQGKLKGTVAISPVVLNGTDVKAATFYNYKFIDDFCLYPGQLITVKKSGEVIPKIVAVDGVRIPVKTDYKNEKEFREAYNKASEEINKNTEKERFDILPSNDLSYCPSCGTHLVLEGVDKVCRNENCKDKVISKLEHFILSVGIEELGRPSIELLYEAGFNDIKSLLSISKEQLSNIPGFGETSAETFISQRNKILHDGLPMSRILYAYDVFEGTIGEKTCQMIFDNLNHGKTELEDLIKIKGVSEVTATSFIEGLKRYDTLLFLLIPYSYIQTPSFEPSGDKLKDWKVCFSGVRDKSLEDIITANGGEIVSGVSKNTTHLILQDINSESSKAKKAKELGTIILSIDTLREQLINLI